MAHMYPAVLRDSTQSFAERKLYPLFESLLGPQFHVFHSVTWQVPDVRSGATDGEADFLIAHPQLGLLDLEVKGGHITFDGPSARWFSNRTPIDDPFDQAKKNKYSLLKLLKGLPHWRNKWLSIGHAVAFPDAAVYGSLRLDAPRDIVMDASDLATLEQWVTQAMQHWRGQEGHFTELGSEGINALAAVLSASWDLRLRLGKVIEAEATEIKRLTESQFRLLDVLARRRRAKISGCAGSGKTTLAVEKSTRLAHQGMKVLLTCYNRALAEYLASQYGDLPGIEIRHFHGLAAQWCRRAGLWPASGTFDARFFEDTVPELLMQAAEALGSDYDAVVVDEGQDFSAHWWVPLLSLTRDPDHGFLYVFYDDNQNLYGGEVGVDGLNDYLLDQNLRNSRHIHQQVVRFYRSPDGTRPEAVGPLGRAVEFLGFSDSTRLKAELQKTLHRLVNDEGVPPEDVVILTPHGRERSGLWGLGRLGNFELTDDWSLGGNHVFVSTIHGFKGLESPVVILAEIDANAVREIEKLYVGCSRAVSHLVVLATDEAIHMLTQDTLAQLDPS